MWDSLPPAPATRAWPYSGPIAGSASPDARVHIPGVDLQLSFYNIGWNYKSKKHNAKRLATEVQAIVQTHRVDTVGLSEIFNIKDAI